MKSEDIFGRFFTIFSWIFLSASISCSPGSFGCCIPGTGCSSAGTAGTGSCSRTSGPRPPQNLEAGGNIRVVPDIRPFFIFGIRLAG